MNRFDFTPYRRTTVGFDRLFDLLERQARIAAGDNYPPFNIERQGEDAYRITLAVAGFKPAEIDIVAQQNLLTIKGEKAEMRERVPGASTVPQILIDGQAIGGSDDLAALDRAGKLDALLGA